MCLYTIKTFVLNMNRMQYRKIFKRIIQMKNSLQLLRRSTIRLKKDYKRKRLKGLLQASWQVLLESSKKLIRICLLYNKGVLLLHLIKELLMHKIRNKCQLKKPVISQLKRNKSLSLKLLLKRKEENL